MNQHRVVILASLLNCLLCGLVLAQLPDVEQQERQQKLQLMDLFEMEFALDPQISPDGKTIVYVRIQHDVMNDRRRTDLWMIDSDGNHLPLFSGKANYSSPRWSPTGDRIVYVSNENDTNQIHCYWVDSRRTAQLTNLTQAPGSLTWSADGRHIAFSMRVPDQPKPFAALPAKPKGAKWADPPAVIKRLNYRADGAGYLPHGYVQLFTLSAEGGTPRQITHGEFNHGGPYGWVDNDSAIVFSANRHPDYEYQPANSEIYKVNLTDRQITQLTDRAGPDSGPVVSPDGKTIAYTGHDEKYLGYQSDQLYLMDTQGGNKKVLVDNLDSNIGSVSWSSSGTLSFLFDNQGITRLATTNLDGQWQVIAENIGGTSLGRPYGGGSYSVSRDNSFAFTLTSPNRPADVARINSGGPVEQLTGLNDDLFAFKKLGKTEELRFKSSHDGIDLQGWVIYPPNFDAQKKYPLILEIHGGPFANYGPRFTGELQLMAAAGYIVLYMNPRGSTSYGAEFANLIHHNYPGNDYDDLISGVDAVIAKGSVDTDNLFVTGGSGGGVLTSWIVGKTDRFRAAVVCKPVINWYSFALTADMYNYFYKYWFPGKPWDHQEEYMRRSPISLVGNVTTPTMLLTGTEDYRTPMSESEQYYQALKLQKVDTVLVRIPGASHSIGARPSQLIAKVAHILKWFDSHKSNESTSEPEVGESAGAGLR